MKDSSLDSNVGGDVLTQRIEFSLNLLYSRRDTKYKQTEAKFPLRKMGPGLER